MKRKALSATTAIIAGLAVLALSVVLRVAATTEEEAAGRDGTAWVETGGNDENLPEAIPALPRGIAEAHAVTGWSRAGTGTDARWSIAWKSDAVTAARILGWLVAEGDGVSFALTPTPDGGWTVEATIDGTGTAVTTATGGDTAPNDLDQLTRLLERSSRSGTIAATVPGEGDSGGGAPIVEDTGDGVFLPDSGAAGSVRGIAGGGSGFIRIGGSHYSWLHRDEALYLEPVR
jgi:hypothetical protein